MASKMTPLANSLALPARLCLRTLQGFQPRAEGLGPTGAVDMSWRSVREKGGWGKETYATKPRQN